MRRARRAAGWTQTILAERSQLPQATISRLETGRFQQPSWRVVQAIADALGVDPRTLFGDNADNGGEAA